MRTLVVTWGPGSNLPPLVAAARLLVARGHEGTMPASGETRAAAGRAGLPVVGERDLGARRRRHHPLGLGLECDADIGIRAASQDARDAIDALRP
jgi:hypothetical protein